MSKQAYTNLTSSEESVVKGYSDVEDSLIEAIKGHGVELIEAMGMPFDPLRSWPFPLVNQGAGFRTLQDSVRYMVCTRTRHTFEFATDFVHVLCFVVSVAYTRNPKTQNPKPKTSNPKPQILNPKP